MVYLGECIQQMQSPCFMHSRRELPFEIDPGQAQRFQCANPLGIEVRSSLIRHAAVFLDLFHSFLKPRVRVDKSFSGVSHAVSNPF